MSAGTVRKHIVQTSLCDSRKGRRCYGESRGSCQGRCKAKEARQLHLHTLCEARDLVEAFHFFLFSTRASHVDLRGDGRAYAFLTDDGQDRQTVL